MQTENNAKFNIYLEDFAQYDTYIVVFSHNHIGNVVSCGTVPYGMWVMFPQRLS